MAVTSRAGLRCRRRPGGRPTGAAGERALARIFSFTLNGGQEAATPVATTASGIGMVVWDEEAQTAAYTVKLSGLDFGPLLGMAP